MFDAIARFFLTGPDAVPLKDEAEIKRQYRKRRISVFLSITMGYAVYRRLGFQDAGPFRVLTRRMD